MGIAIHENIADVKTDDFIRIMLTNALCPMRVVESLQGLVSANGLIGVMSLATIDLVASSALTDNCWAGIPPDQTC